MKAVILAGGKGKRLEPYTLQKPKPMLTIGDKPLLEYVIEHLWAHDIKDIFLSVSYMGEQIKSYFGDGSEFGVNITYSLDDPPRGTAGSVARLKDELDDTFLVLSGDVLTDINLIQMVSFHQKQKGIGTIALYNTKKPMEFGIIKIDHEKQIIHFEEKPILEHLVNAGIYVLEPEIFKYVKGEEALDFSHDLFPRIMQAKEELYGYVIKGYWCDVGAVNDYEIAMQIGGIMSGIMDRRKNEPLE